MRTRDKYFYGGIEKQCSSLKNLIVKKLKSGETEDIEKILQSVVQLFLGNSGTQDMNYSVDVHDNIIHIKLNLVKGKWDSASKISELYPDLESLPISINYILRTIGLTPKNLQSDYDKFEITIEFEY